jgi:DNA-binding MarR family transcriptional regulator
VNIIFTHGWLIEHQNRLLKEYKVTGAQFNILRILRGQHPNPASVNLLKERMLDKMSDASRLVDRLISKGFVDRKICPDDRRRVEVKITDAGLSLLEKIDEHNNEFDNNLIHLSEHDAKTINDLLDKLRG